MGVGEGKDGGEEAQPAVQPPTQAQNSILGPEPNLFENLTYPKQRLTLGEKVGFSYASQGQRPGSAGM